MAGLIPLFLAHPGLNQEARIDSTRQGRGDTAFVEMYGRIWHYFRMDNPREAARLLLLEAQERSVDIDLLYSFTLPPRKIEFPSGLVVDPRDSPKENFVRSLKSLPGYVSVGVDEIICVVRLSRSLSIRNAAELLSLGLKIYDQGPAHCLIARVPLSSIQSLVELQYIDWISEFKTEYKYNPKVQFGAGKPILVESIMDGNDALRADFRQTGARVKSYSPSLPRLYEVAMDSLDIDALASLWWVKIIFTIAVAPDEGASIRKRPNREPSNFCHIVNFNPEDSRKFVSAGYDNEFGANQKIGIVDGGCDDWHDDLHDKFDYDISDIGLDLHWWCTVNICLTAFSLFSLSDILRLVVLRRQPTLLCMFM
jgi:hypothetical protein